MEQRICHWFFTAQSWISRFHPRDTLCLIAEAAFMVAEVQNAIGHSVADKGNNATPFYPFGAVLPFYPSGTSGYE